MSIRSLKGMASSRRIALVLTISAFASVGSPLVATSSASSVNDPNQVSATFGDCKNDNPGNHYGYVCPVPSNGGDDGGVPTVIIS